MLTRNFILIMLLLLLHAKVSFLFVISFIEVASWIISTVAIENSLRSKDFGLSRTFRQTGERIIGKLIKDRCQK